MTIERWGAFSVIDHKDARKLAAEVILYDRLLMPKPVDWDRGRWVEKEWDPAGMDDRIRQLGDIAIPVNWDCDRQKEWQKKFGELREDVRDLNSALNVTKRVLADQARAYRPPGVSAIEVLAAYQSEADFEHLDSRATDTERANARSAEFNFLVANQILIPNEEDAEESLKRAIGLLGESKFVERRRRFHEWQRFIQSQGITPGDAADELRNLVSQYNEAVTSSGRSYRTETAILLGALSVTALATTASLVPAAFAAVGIGVLKGAQVISIGTAASSGILQIARHIRGRRDPDAATLNDMSGAMFHQMEKETGWTLRTTGS